MAGKSMPPPEAFAVSPRKMMVVASPIMRGPTTEKAVERMDARKTRTKRKMITNLAQGYYFDFDKTAKKYISGFIDFRVKNVILMDKEAHTRWLFDMVNLSGPTNYNYRKLGYLKGGRIEKR